MSPMWIIASREVNGILHQRRMVLFAVGFGVIIPLLAGAGFVGLAVRVSSLVNMGSVGRLHATVRVVGLPGLVQSLLVWLGIFPILFSAQFAAVTFAAERERRSLHALLATPASLTAMILGKLIASLIPGFLTVISAYAVYVTSVAVAAPEASQWIPFGTIVSAACCLISLSVLVNGTALLISSRSRTVMGASSTVTFVSLPVSVVTVLFAVTIATLGPIGVFAVAAAIMSVAAGILALGIATWKRGEILAS